MRVGLGSRRRTNSELMMKGFSGGSVIKSPPANAGSIPDLGRSLISQDS